MTTAPRVPELRPGQLGGLGIRDARATRVRVAPDGDLVLERPDGSRVVLCPAGRATRICWVAPEEIRPDRFTPSALRGLVLVWEDERLAAALSLADWWRLGSALSNQDLRATSGLDAVAEALGLVVERADPQEVARARSLRPRDLVVPRDPSSAPRASLPAAWATLVASFLSVLAVTEGWWWALALPFLGLLPLTLGLLRRRQDFATLVASLPEPRGRRGARPRPARPTTVNLAETELQVDAHDVVLVFEGTEWWLPGPAAGGVVRLDAHPDLVLLRDRRDRVLLALDGELWGAAIEEVVDACALAGIDVRRSPQPSFHAEPPLPSPAAEGQWPARVHHGDDGAVDLQLPVLVNVAATTHLLGTLLGTVTPDGGDPVRIVACAVGALACAALLALSAHAAALSARWQRRQRRWVVEPPPLGHRAATTHRRRPSSPLTPGTDPRLTWT